MLFRSVQNVKVMYAAEKSNAVLFLYLGARLDAKKPERIQIRGVYAGSTSNPKTGETFHLFNIEYLDGEGNLRRAWVPVDPADRQNPERMRAIRQSLGEKGLSVRTVFGEALSFVDQALSEDESVS